MSAAAIRVSLLALATLAGNALRRGSTRGKSSHGPCLDVSGEYKRSKYYEHEPGLTIKLAQNGCSGVASGDKDFEFTVSGDVIAVGSETGRISAQAPHTIQWSSGSIYKAWVSRIFGQEEYEIYLLDKSGRMTIEDVVSSGTRRHEEYEISISRDEAAVDDLHAALRARRELNQQSKVSVITFQKRANQSFGMDIYGLSNKYVVPDAYKFTLSIRAGGGSCISCALDYACRMARWKEQVVKRVVLLASGPPTEGITSASELAAFWRDGVCKNISVDTILFASDSSAAADVLKAIAESSAGSFKKVSKDLNAPPLTPAPTPEPAPEPTNAPPLTPAPTPEPAPEPTVAPELTWILAEEREVGNWDAATSCTAACEKRGMTCRASEASQITSEGSLRYAAASAGAHCSSYKGALFDSGPDFDPSSRECFFLDPWYDVQSDCGADPLPGKQRLCACRA